ncbi:MAG: 30S ribosome-binding factor RbfA [Patescibacteria group bacterium]
MSKRTYRVNELIKEEVSQILLKELGSDFGFITVLAVDTRRDLRHATVWVSIIGEKAKAILTQLEDKEKNIQSQLNKRLVLKYVPKLTFELDHSGEYATEIGKTLKKIRNDQK